MNELPGVLSQLAELLMAHGWTEWAGVFEQAHTNFAAEPDRSVRLQMARELLGSFRGSGSLGDIVLSWGGLPLVAENERLEVLRNHLHQLLTDVRLDGASPW